MTAGDWPWPAPTDDGGADHLVRGLQLPDMPLPSSHGAAINLARCRGRTVVFIYPWTGRAGLANPPDWDHIPGAHGSTPQAENFARAYDQFRAVGCEVYGLSGQDGAHHRELSNRLALPFALLSDDDLSFARALRLPTFETGGITFLKRLTLLVRNGAIDAVLYPVHPPDRSAADTLIKLQV